MTTTLRVGTWNLYEYGRHWREADAAARYKQVASVLAELDCDVIAVQEVCGRGRADLEHLAREAGFSCWYDPPWADEDGGHIGRVAIADTGARESDFHVGLLWRRSDKIRPYLDGFRGYPGAEFWHAAVIQAFRVEGLDRPIFVGSYHSTPFQQDARPDEARRIASILTRPYGSDRLAIIGADWNSISADRVQDSDGWRYWHPDPYWPSDRPNEWREAYGYQCVVDEDDEQGRPVRWHADRRPGEVLLRAGCRDAAALAGAAWAPSVGHYDHADMGHRCIDTHRVSPGLAPAVVGWEVIDTAASRAASDHLPVITSLDLSSV